MVNKIERIFKISLLVLSFSIITPNNPLKTVFAFACIGYVITSSLIPRLASSFIKIGLKGRDLSKPPPSVEIAESMGIVCAVTYMILMFCMIPFIFFKYLVSLNSNIPGISNNYTDQYMSVSNIKLFPHDKLAAYLSAVLCLQSTTLLGIFDDLFDIKWRHKFFLPALASLPLLIVYYVDFSITSILVPGFLTNSSGGELIVDTLNLVIRLGNHIVTYLTGLTFRTLESDYVVPESSPKLLDLGVFYYLYMSAVSIFSPNSINILAGINGLEVGQSIVLALILLLNDFCYVFSENITQAAYDSHVFSIIFLLPFLGVSLALFRYNWYPSKVFVGDTYCYFSGMVFAIVGILGHFSKTLLIFLLPQILNFIYSVPQLFGLVPCPRHRLPRFDAKTGLMYPSFGEIKNPRVHTVILLSTLNKLGLIELKRDPNSREITSCSNMTIINLFLVWFGPMREDKLCILILAFQSIIGVLMLIIRHTLGPWLFGYDNLSWGVK